MLFFNRALGWTTYPLVALKGFIRLDDGTQAVPNVAVCFTFTGPVCKLSCNLEPLCMSKRRRRRRWGEV